MASPIDLSFIYGPHMNGFRCFAADGDLQTIDRVHGRVAGRSAADHNHVSFGNESHVHKVMLNLVRQIDVLYEGVLPNW